MYLVFAFCVRLVIDRQFFCYKEIYETVSLLHGHVASGEQV